MDIRQIEYFIAAAQRGNFTKAAEDLFITRQALSKAVRNLEHETGLTLMDNKDGRLELTAEGRMLFDDAEPVVAAYRNLEERYANTVKHPPVRQTLAVSMAHGTAQSMPRNTIDAFCMDHPDVLLSVEEVTTEAALGMARSGESDISLVGSAPPYLGGFDLMLVVETGTYVFVPRESPLAARKRLAAADIEGQPFVTFGKRNHLHRFFVETCEAAGVKPNIIMTTFRRAPARAHRRTAAGVLFRLPTPHRTRRIAHARSGPAGLEHRDGLRHLCREAAGRRPVVIRPRVLGFPGEGVGRHGKGRRPAPFAKGAGRRTSAGQSVSRSSGAASRPSADLMERIPGTHPPSHVPGGGSLQARTSTEAKGYSAVARGLGTA